MPFQILIQLIFSIVDIVYKIKKKVVFDRLENQYPKGYYKKQNATYYKETQTDRQKRIKKQTRSNHKHKLLQQTTPNQNNRQKKRRS